jgi:hypothetical protein
MKGDRGTRYKSIPHYSAAHLPQDAPTGRPRGPPSASRRRVQPGRDEPEFGERSAAASAAKLPAGKEHLTMPADGHPMAVTTAEAGANKRRRCLSISPPILLPRDGYLLDRGRRLVTVLFTARSPTWARSLLHHLNKENPMIRRGVIAAALGLLLCALATRSFSQPEHGEPFAANGNIQITLKKDFIKTYKSRVTIDADDFVIDMAHKHPNPPKKDGDMHVAGRADSIGLPVVAEIMNAGEDAQAKAVDKVHELEGTGKKVKVSGVWRLWCEHAGTSRQVMGAPLQPFKTTNPDHVFEIHPVTKLDGLDIRGSFKPIKGFPTKDAHDAFVKYENTRCEIRPKGETVTLVTHMAGFNYVEFILELNEDPFKLPNGDGYFAQCKVRDLEGELLVRNRRMAFAEGTPPAREVKDLKKGKRMHVLGIPRIDLALVAWRVEHAGDDEWKDEKPLTWNLPYEIVVVAVYPAGTGDDD